MNGECGNSCEDHGEVGRDGERERRGESGEEEEEEEEGNGEPRAERGARLDLRTESACPTEKKNRDGFQMKRKLKHHTPIQPQGVLPPPRLEQNILSCWIYLRAWKHAGARKSAQ